MTRGLLVTFFVEEEISSQPRCWRRAATLAADLRPLLTSPGDRVAFVGCGTSWFVAQVLAHWREAHGYGESDAYSASEVPPRSWDRVVALTRSGTTTEVVELLRQLHGRIPTTAILGDVHTPAAEHADRVVDLSFADERSVVQTRFATTTLALFRSAYGEPLGPLADQAAAVLDEPLADELVNAEEITFLGRGWTVGIAHEAALKFRETSSSWAESYPAMDYRHGPLAIAGPGRGVWLFGAAPNGLADEVRATGARFVSSARDPMVELVLAQRVAVARAIALGRNPDEPAHLSRSVVLTG
jgi:fructoselysine-6-P-deglycase FrlB-like protein